MREIIEFRIPEENAGEFLPDDLGERLGDSVRKVELDATDPLVGRIAQLDREFRLQGRKFFCWDIRRRYTGR